MLIEQPAKWLRWLYPRATWRMDKNERSVYLTFDDGPIPEFYLFQQPHDLYTQIVQEGHQVGNHTYNHIGSLKHWAITYAYNTEKANQLIHAHLFRPPHGWMKHSVYWWMSRRYRIIMWDVVTRDYSKWMTAEDIFENVKKYTRNGSIITFHDSLKSIEKLHYALPKALQWLKDQGYEFKTFE